MEIVRSTPTLTFQPNVEKETSVTQARQSVHIFVEGKSCQISVGNSAHRQEIKEMLGAFSITQFTDNGRPHFSSASGEQKASLKALLYPISD